MLKINDGFVSGLATTIGAKISSQIARKLGSSGVKKFQQLTTASDFVAGLFGVDNVEDTPQPLLGGFTLREAEAQVREMGSADMARSNLFFIELVDPNPPDLGVGTTSPPKPPIPQDTFAGPAASFMSGILSGGIGQIASQLKRFGLSLPSQAQGASQSQSTDIPYVLNMFATSVSYSAQELSSERVQVGGASIDKITGASPIEITITSMDDGIGSLKRWFDAKCYQAVNPDGTFGLPSKYCVAMRIFHATPRPHDRAYTMHTLLRPKSIQHELNRREQSMQELVMVFEQPDTFMSPEQIGQQ